IFLIDIFEHFTKEDGERLLSILLKKGKNILISTPKNMQVQNDVFGNEFEIHRYNWSRKDFIGFKNKTFISNDYSLIILLGENYRDVKKRFSPLNRFIKQLRRK